MLPAAWIDSLFARLQVRYGAAWNRMWEGIDMAVVKADWAEELGGFERNPSAIGRALNGLPVDWPPTVAQFKALCIGEPGDIEQSQPILPAPPADPARVAEIVAKIPREREKVPARKWSEDLRKREQSLGRLTMAQRTMWRAALRAPDEQTKNVASQLIDRECLPPGMRGRA